MVAVLLGDRIVVLLNGWVVSFCYLLIARYSPLFVLWCF